MEIFHHTFFPKASNNYKAKILHNLSLFTLAAFVVLISTIVDLLSVSQVGILGYASSIPPAEVVSLTNQKRAENGVGQLTYSEALSEAARQKAYDMLEDDYWAHVAPDGTEPWAFFKNVGYTYRYAGENLARDFSSPNTAIDAWLASPSHRENMLAGKYTEIGVAVIEGDLAGKDTTLIVQLFGTPAAAAPAIVPDIADESQISDSVIVPVVEAQEIVVGEPEPEPLVLASQFDVMRTATLAVVGIMFVVLLVDLVAISRRGITRTGGKTFAHLSFMAMVIIIIVLAKAGEIL